MDRIIKILKTLNRPGIDQVIEFMKENNYEGSKCYDHHKYKGGLVDHSLEVYDHMMKNRGDLPEDSIIVCDFFHDLGKASKSTRQIKDHEGRSVRLLDKCGFPLTAQEPIRTARGTDLLKRLHSRCLYRADASECACNPRTCV